MINLIPDTTKKNTVFAKRNSLLLKYAFASALTMLMIVFITVASILKMTYTQNSLNNEFDNQQVKIASYKGVEQKGQALADQISTIKELLNRQIKFSELFPDFAKILPTGSIILSLDFKASDFTGEVAAGQKATKPEEKPFVIRAATDSTQTATTLLENIKARTDLFVGADLIDITKLEAGSGENNVVVERYPYQVTINAYLKPKSSSQNTKQETPVNPLPQDRNSETAR